MEIQRWEDDGILPKRVKESSLKSIFYKIQITPEKYTPAILNVHVPRFALSSMIESGTFRHQTIFPLVVSPPKRPPPSRFAPTSRFATIVAPCRLAVTIYKKEDSGEFAVIKYIGYLITANSQLSSFLVTQQIVICVCEFSVCPSIHWSIHQFVHPSYPQPFCLSICLSVRLSVFSSVRTSIHQSVCPNFGAVRPRTTE